MGLEVGSVFARVGARLDDTGFNRFDERIRRARREAERPIEARGGMRYNGAGHDQYIKATRSATHETGNFHKALEGGEGRLGRYAIGMREAGVALVGGAGVFGLVEGMRAAIDRAGELEKTQRQTAAVIKSTGGEANVSAEHVENLAKRLGNMAGQDHEVVQAGANILLTFRGIRNEAGKNNDIFDQATRATQNLATAMHMDMSSAALQVGKALNDPAKGMTRLQRIGVTFTKGQLETAKKLEETGHHAAAQKIILEELNKEFGGSAHAAGQTMPAALNRLKVSILDGFGKLGTFAAPAIEGAAKGLNHFVKWLSGGGAASGKFGADVKAGFGAVKDVAHAVFSFVGKVIKDNGDTFRTMGNTIGKVAGDIKRLLNGVLGAFRSTFSGQGTGKDLRTIIRDVLLVMAAVQKVEEAIVRRALPGIITAFRGLAQIIRGIVEVIAGILTLRFGKVWDGLKDIFGGGVKLIAGVLRAGTAGVREAAQRIGEALGRVISHGVDDAVGFFKALPGRIVSALSGLPGLLAGLAGKAVGAFGHALSGLPGAIGNALKGGGQFLGDIGHSIAQWLNDHTPLGDKVKIGPLSVRLPSLARGGKPGNVGPGHGGARLFVAGEGSLDEWVISQEGPRGQNVAWAREALETLTGRRVELYAKGKGAKKKKGALKPVLDTSGTKRRVSGGEAGIKDFERDIARMERKYGLDERGYAADDTDFVLEHDDGTSSLDSSAIENRLRDLGSLHAERKDIRDKYALYKTRVEGLVTTYGAAVRRLTNAIKAARSSKRKKERQGYLNLRQGYTTRMGELRDLAKDLDLDVIEQNADLSDLEREAAGLAPDKRGALLPAGPAPAAKTPEDYYGPDAGAIDSAQRELALDTVGLGQQPGGVAEDNADLVRFFTSTINRALAAGAPTDVIESLSSTLAGYLPSDKAGGGSGGGSSSSGTPSAEDVAAAAIAQVSAFNAARADLFGNYGSNFMAAGAPGLAAGEPFLAAGARYFGAVGGQGGKGGAGAPTVTQVISFPTPPADPHGWTQASLHEMRAAL